MLHIAAQINEAADAIRRQWDHELGVQTLTPIRPLSERLKAWSDLTGKNIELLVGRQRAPVFDCRIRAAINGLPEFPFCQLFYLLDAGLRRVGRRTTLRRLLHRLISGHLNRVRRWRALRHSHH